MIRKPSAETVIRTALLVLAILNNALAIVGKSPLPVESEALTEVIGFLFTTGAALWAWWKNNSFTEAAMKADRYMQELKR